MISSIDKRMSFQMRDYNYMVARPRSMNTIIAQ